MSKKKDNKLKVLKFEPENEEEWLDDPVKFLEDIIKEIKSGLPVSRISVILANTEKDLTDTIVMSNHEDPKDVLWDLELSKQYLLLGLEI